MRTHYAFGSLKDSSPGAHWTDQPPRHLQGQPNHELIIEVMVIIGNDGRTTTVGQAAINASERFPICRILLHVCGKGRAHAVIPQYNNQDDRLTAIDLFYLTTSMP